MDIPWTEKYRPTRLDNIVSQTESKNILANTLKDGHLPHLMIYGPPGTGKTSSIIALCNQLFGPKRVSERVLELNASDERGIGVVRNKIINFAKVSVGTRDPKYLCPDYKVIILDEADAMTKEAQAALRKVMEENSEITRFCFLCNYQNKLIEPIESRCVKIRFNTIDKDSIISRLEYISQKENLQIKDKTIYETLAEISNGDLRKGILILQNLKYFKCDNNLTSEKIYSIYKYITKEELDIYIEKLKKNKNIKNVIEIVKDIQSKGYIISYLILKINNYLMDMKIEEKTKAIFIFTTSSIERKLNDGADEYIQLLNLITKLMELV